MTPSGKGGPRALARLCGLLRLTLDHLQDAFETQSLLRALRRDKSDLLETVTDLEKDNARELERVQDEHDAELRDRADRVEEQRVRAMRLERELGRLRQDAAVLEAILGRAVAHINRLPDGHLHSSSFSLAAFTLRTLEPEEPDLEDLGNVVVMHWDTGVAVMDRLLQQMPLPYTRETVFDRFVLVASTSEVPAAVVPLASRVFQVLGGFAPDLRLELRPRPEAGLGAG